MCLEVRWIASKQISADPTGPRLPYDTHATIDEATRLFDRLGRKKVMIKIPAAVGDFRSRALRSRRAMHIDLGADVAQGLKRLRDYRTGRAAPGLDHRRRLKAREEG